MDYGGKYRKIRKALYEAGFDDFHQAGSVSEFHKMNIACESWRLSARFWVCIDGGCGVKDTFSIVKRKLPEEGSGERTYYENQGEMAAAIERIGSEIRRRKMEGKIYTHDEARLVALVATALVNMASEPQVTAETGLPRFRDVPATFWAYDDIEYAVSRGIINGIGDEKFGPNQTVSPGQFATMLVRTFFPDDVSTVDPSTVMEMWHGTYMVVAKDRYLLGNTTVNSVYSKARGTDFWTLSIVDGPMNRYDLAQMLYNMANKSDGVELPRNPIIDAEELIPDFSEVPPWNRVAVAACFRMGLLDGVDQKGTFAGYLNVTRAQAATVLSRFLQEYGFERGGDNVLAQESESTPWQDEQKTGRDPAGNTYSWNVNRIRDIGKATLSRRGVPQAPRTQTATTRRQTSHMEMRMVYGLLDLVNASRAEAGVAPLYWVNGTESDAAEEYTLLRAYEITSLYSHKRPRGESLSCATEIIVIDRADAQEAHRAWVLSSGHKRAMTNSEYKDMCAARCGNAWVVMFWCGFDYTNLNRYEKISHNYHYNCSKGAYGPHS